MGYGESGGERERASCGALVQGAGSQRARRTCRGEVTVYVTVDVGAPTTSVVQREWRGIMGWDIRDTSLTRIVGYMQGAQSATVYLGQ